MYNKYINKINYYLNDINVTELELSIENHQKYYLILCNEFPDYTVTYSDLSRIYKITNKTFQTTIGHYVGRKIKIQTIHIGEHLGFNIFNVILCLILIFLSLKFKNNRWIIYLSFITIYIILKRTLFINYLNKVKQEHQKNIFIIKSHDKLT